MEASLSNCLQKLQSNSRCYLPGWRVSTRMKTLPSWIKRPSFWIFDNLLENLWQYSTLLTVVLEGADGGARKTRTENERSVVQLVTEYYAALGRNKILITYTQTIIDYSVYIRLIRKIYPLILRSLQKKSTQMQLSWIAKEVGQQACSTLNQNWTNTQRSPCIYASFIISETWKILWTKCTSF